MADETTTAVMDAPTDPGAGDPEGSVAVEAPSRPEGGPRPATPPSGSEPGPAPQPVARREPTPEREPPPAEPPAASLLDWREMIPEEVRRDKVWDKYTSMPEALKALANQERLLGEMVRVPPDGASDGQLRAFYERLGCPPHPGDYVLTDPDMGTDADGTPQTLEPDFLTALLEHVHQAGLTNRQAQQVVDFAARTAVRGRNIAAGEAAMQRAQTERELYDAFGGEAPEMIKKAYMFVTNMGSGRYGGGTYAERLAAKLQTGPMANDIDLIAAFANGWDNFREGIWVGDASHGSMTSLDTLKGEIDALNAVVNNDSKAIEERNQALALSMTKQRQYNEIAGAQSRRQQTLRR